MALLLAFMSTTSERSSANLSATDVVEPTRLILEDILATQARFCRQVWAFGAIFIVTMTSVWHLRMATILGALTGKSTGRRLGTAG